MKHLTVDEIIDFVSIKEINRNTMELASRVNGHIAHCDECLELVRAFQLVRDEFYKLYESGDFRKYVAENYPEKLKDMEAEGDR